ncbi:MAG TPA: hypothetical protein VMW50_08795 [Dehalococcoidia bacterium]|nr:hypothetical protein [Dehalococcoidia bacterium]
MSLRNQIFKTAEVLQQDRKGTDKETLVLENQYEIMRALFKIDEDLQRVKKNYPHPDFGPA